MIRFALHIHHPPQPGMNSPTQEAAPIPAPDVSPATSQAGTPVPSARAMLKQLQERFVAFRDCLPLAIGIDKQLFAALPDLSRKTVRLAMRSHTMTTRYLKEMEKGTQRLNLDGSPAGDVTDENRQHASELLKERFKKQAEHRKAAEQAARAESRKQEKLLALTEKFGRK